ncbi:hypothetical protein PIB30_005015 [Stylosanthes scabra]|uniref:Uncharacterized protein n=1 Tax=Stylosanthes scabra TaxID=79078 RepID=A0ABU6Y130_9FABA|nr:hypothetical protein [Stylosanthes scabra]
MSYDLRYKVEVLAYDRTHCITLLLWDSAVVPLCGKKADEIIGEDTEELGYPLTLDNILEKRAQFKINVRASNYEKDDKVYIVDLVCEDEDLVNKYLPEDSENEPTVTDAVCELFNMDQPICLPYYMFHF